MSKAEERAILTSMLLIRVPPEHRNEAREELDALIAAVRAEERERILNAVTMLHIRDSDLYAQIAAAIRRAEKRENDWLSAASEWRQRADAAEARVAELEADVARARLSSAVASCAVLGWALIQGILWLISHARFV